MYMWFPYKTPELSEFPYNIPSLSLFKGSLSDFEHLGLRDSEHRYFLDFVPVDVRQMTGAPESLHVWLENREMVSMGNIYCGSRVCKKKMCRKADFRRFLGLGSGLKAWH
jgi:hypothetical protein